MILSQNFPNPFINSTTIEYNLPKELTTASLNIYTTEGIQIKSMIITSRGKGSIEVLVEDLVPGIYIYALDLDNVISERKKMILSRN
jgi:hypothetical protein